VAASTRVHEERAAVSSPTNRSHPSNSQEIHCSPSHRIPRIGQGIVAGRRSTLEVGYSCSQNLLGRYDANCSNNAFASFRSRVSNPSVNQPYTGANSSRACCTLPWSRLRRARLMAARSSQDLAC
jgi:hypothetical protein